MDRCKLYFYDFIKYYLLFLFANVQLQKKDLDVKLTKIWGPGLTPSNIMPARYFFIQGIDTNGQMFSDLPTNKFQININGLNVDNMQRFCRIWTNILNRKDGSLIVRYKVYEPCTKFGINILYNGYHVGGSPYLYNDTVILPEECQNPIKTEIWLDEFNCNTGNYEQVISDLETFPSIDISEMYSLAIKKFNGSRTTSACDYVILNNEVYRKCYGEHTGFKMFMDSILLSITRKAHLPDMEFFVNLGDWPLIENNDLNKFPLISWCGAVNKLDMVIPTYDITESTLQNMGRVTLDMLSVQGNIKYSWQKKINAAFWRGRDSSRERLKLIAIARKHPELFNASLTNFFFFKDVEFEYGPKQPHVSFFTFFDYKYQLSLDGTVAAYRLPYLLAGDSLVFKQESEYYEHFYRHIKPWIHFVPIKRDLSDLVEKLQWAQSHDEEAKTIALKGQQFARDSLLPKDIFCYHVFFFNEYSKRLKGDVMVRDGMELVHQPSQEICNHTYIRKNDEL